MKRLLCPPRRERSPRRRPSSRRSGITRLLQPSATSTAASTRGSRAASRGATSCSAAKAPVPYFVSPLYAYFLAATGPSFPAARAVQILLGTAAVALVFLTARRLFGERAALARGRPLRARGRRDVPRGAHPAGGARPVPDRAVPVPAGGGGREKRKKRISLKVKEGRGADGGASAARGGRSVAAGAAGGLLTLNRPNALLCVAAVPAALFLFTFKENPLRRRGDRCGVRRRRRRHDRSFHSQKSPRLP